MSHSIKIMLVIASLVVISPLHAQILSSKQINQSTNQFQKSEWKLDLKTDWKNPYDFQEIALNMMITSPSGKKLTLPCYYESGESQAESIWKARFTPREQGAYMAYFELRKQREVVSETESFKFNAVASPAKGFLSVNDLWTLRYDNGAPFRAIGENFCWESRDEDDSKYFKSLHEDKRFNYDYMLKKLAANGGNFFRTWMIYWNLPVDWRTIKNNNRYQNTTSPFNESGMKRMDHLVELCDSLGIHMMLALESHVGYMGDGWDMSSYNVANGGAAKTPLEFFTLPEAKQQYKNKLRLMVARYGYSPSIGAWEFFNEIDNAMYNGKPEDRIPDAVIKAWHDEMSTFLKTVDPYKHIVTTSVSHRDVEGMNDLKNIDINQKHIYKNINGIPGTLRDYTAKHNKPYVIGEAGYEWDWSKNFNEFGTEMDGDFKRGLWYGLFNPTPILPMSWWWEFFESRGMMTYFNQVAEINRAMLQAGNGKLASVSIEGTSREIHCYGVRCGKKLFVYLYNSNKTTESISFKTNENLKKNGKVKYFECETGKYSTVSYKSLDGKVIEMEKLKLKPNSDIVLIWE
jgi:hypothetical protein